MSGESPWLTAKEAADYVRAPSVKAFYEWKRRHGVASARYGSRLRFLRSDLDLALGGAHRRALLRRA